MIEICEEFAGMLSRALLVTLGIESFRKDAQARDPSRWFLGAKPPLQKAMPVARCPGGAVRRCY